MVENMKKQGGNKNKNVMLFGIFILFAALSLKIPASAAKIEDGTYQVQVDLWNAAADKASMGNAALNHEAVLTVKDGAGTLKVEFKGMTFSGLTGYLSQLDLLTDIRFNEVNYPETYNTVPATVISTHDFVDEYNSADSTDINCAGKPYPKELSVPVELGTEYTWVHVYVPIMGSFGAGDQEARLKIDYSTLKKAEVKAVQKLTLNKQKVTLAVGKTAAIKAAATPSGPVKYASSNKKVVTVSAKGVIKAVKKGTARIAVSCNGVKKYVQVTVK